MTENWVHVWSWSLSRRWAVTGVAFVVYVALFAAAQGTWNQGGGFFFLIPMMVGSLGFGLRGGLILGVIAHPTNMLLLALSGSEVTADLVAPERLVAGVFAVVMGSLIGGISSLAASRAEVNRRLQQTNNELETALAEIKTLNGLLPICSYCKKIRDDDGYWQRIESYLREHADVMFTHAYCPDCLKTHFPDESGSLQE